MKRAPTKLLALCLLLCPFASAVGSQSDVTALVDANNGFAVKLYAALAAEKGNLFYSPASISTAVAMAYAGAQGDTRDQMGKVFGFPSEKADFDDRCSRLIAILRADGQHKDFTLSVANRLWG